jgi:hypothetical protein
VIDDRLPRRTGCRDRLLSRPDRDLLALLHLGLRLPEREHEGLAGAAIHADCDPSKARLRFETGECVLLELAERLVDLLWVKSATTLGAIGRNLNAPDQLRDDAFNKLMRVHADRDDWDAAETVWRDWERALAQSRRSNPQLGAWHVRVANHARRLPR